MPHKYTPHQNYKWKLSEVSSQTSIVRICANRFILIIDKISALFITSLMRSSFLFLLSSLSLSRSVSKGPSTGSGFLFLGASSSSIPSNILNGIFKLLTVGWGLTNPCFSNFSDNLLQTCHDSENSLFMLLKIDFIQFNPLPKRYATRKTYVEES